MKILIYSANFAPEPTGIGKYSGEMAVWLAEQGHEVRVVAAPPHYPNWKVAEGYASHRYSKEQRNGVKIWRTPIWIPRHPNGLKRILHQLTFSMSSVPTMLRQIPWRPDVVFTVAPALMCAPTGWLTARLSGSKAWLHVQDFEVDMAFRMGLLKGRMLKSLVLSIERLLLTRFDNVSSISSRMLDLLRRKNVPKERLYFFPNWVDINHINMLHKDSGYRQELGIESDKVVVLFSGTLAGKQGLMIIPEVARRLSARRDIVFVICGDGVMRGELEAASEGLCNIMFLPLQPFERLADFLGMADIHLLPQSPEAEDLVLPSKLSGMLASGRPVIATCRAKSEIGGVVAQCGLVVAPEDSVGLASAVVRLVEDRPTRIEMGLSARRYAENNFAMNVVLARLVKEISDI